MKIHTPWFCLGSILLSFIAVQTQQQAKPGEGKQEPAARASKKPTQKPIHKRVVTDLSGFDLLDPSKAGEQKMVVVATREISRPILMAPRLGKLYGSDPVFSWSYKDKADEFLFVMRDDKQVEVFRAQVRGTKFRYPEDAPRLQPGQTYFWTVELPASALGLIAPETAGFIVVGSSQHQEIENALAHLGSDDPDKIALACVRVFTDYRLWYDALSAYTDLIARHPDRSELYEGRGMIYAQLHVTQGLAQRDFTRAEQIQSNTNAQKK